MNEARAYLFAGEEVALVIRPHPIVLAKSILAPLAAIALFSAFANRFTFIVLLLVLIRFSWDVGMWWMDRFVLTTERILSLAGIITKKVVTLPLAKITDLTYERTLLGRLLGYGSLGFESAGQVDFGRIDFVPDSDEFYRAVMALALGPRPDGHAPDHPGEVSHDDGKRPDTDKRSNEAKISDDEMSADGRHFKTEQIPIVRRSDD